MSYIDDSPPFEPEIPEWMLEEPPRWDSEPPELPPVEQHALADEWQPEESIAIFPNSSFFEEEKGGIQPSVADGWRLQDAGILIEGIYATTDAGKPDFTGEPIEYTVGVYEIWQEPLEGDLTGRYLRMATAPHLERAEEMENNIYRLANQQDLEPDEFGAFAHELIKGRHDWQPLSDRQWGDWRPSPEPSSDTPLMGEDDWEQRNQLLEQAFAVMGEPLLPPAREDNVVGQGLHNALETAPFNLPDFDPAIDPPWLYVPETDTAYWVGLHQPSDSSATLGLVSFSPTETGYAASLAPLASGDVTEMQQAAEYLIRIGNETGDIQRVFETAEGMAMISQQVNQWEHEAGFDLKPDELTDFHPILELD